MRGLFVIFISLFFIQCKSVPVAKYDLRWADEFNVDGLPDEEKWSYEKGFVRNKELQYYTVKDSSTAWVKDGMLRIKLHTSADGQVKSASLHTLGKFEFTHGKVEIRAKLPQGLGVWPAFWTLGTNIGEVGWPTCGEIDVMEYVGHDSNRIHSAIHTQKYNHAQNTSFKKSKKLAHLHDDFHIYSMEWKADQISFFVDGNKFFSCDKKREDDIAAWPFVDAPQYMIVNLAYGGTWGGQQGVNDAILPQEYVIDYIRYYELI